MCWIGNGGRCRQDDSRPCRTGGAEALRNVSPSLASTVGIGSGTDWGWACEHRRPYRLGWGSGSFGHSGSSGPVLCNQTFLEDRKMVSQVAIEHLKCG